MVPRAALLLNGLHYVGVVAPQGSRRIQHSDDPFSCYAEYKRGTYHRFSEVSGWRDVNPRPVAAATVLLGQFVQFVSASPCFEILLLSHSICAIRKDLTVHEHPWCPVPRCF